MSNWRPSVCSRCHGQYVNRGRNCIAGILSGVISIVIVTELAVRFSAPKDFAAVIGGCVFAVAYGAWARPMRYEELKMYTKRSWWEYPLFYVFLPLSVVILGILLVFKYHSAT